MNNNSIFGNMWELFVVFAKRRQNENITTKLNCNQKHLITIYNIYFKYILIFLIETRILEGKNFIEVRSIENILLLNLRKLVCKYFVF